VLELESIHEISWQAYHEAQQHVRQQRREAFVAVAKLRASTNRGFKLMQEEGAGPLTILADADGNLTGSVWKVDSLLQEAWLPIFQKDLDGGPAWQPFQQLVAPHLVSHPWHLEPISSQQVNSALMRLIQLVVPMVGNLISFAWERETVSARGWLTFSIWVSCCWDIGRKLSLSV